MKTLVIVSILLGLCSAYCPHSTTRPPWVTTRPPWVTTRPPWVTTRPPHVRPQNGSCNFDDRPCTNFIRQETNDDFDWTNHAGRTPSYNTGPSGDHTYGYGHYIYTEASGRHRGARARLTAFLITYNPACFHFYYHMYGSEMGTLRISVNHKLVWELSGNQGNQWIRGTFPIHRPGVYTLQIDGIIGPSFTSDIALDDLGYQEFYWMSRDQCMVTPSCANPNSKPPRPTTYPPFPPTGTYPPWTTPRWTYPPWTTPRRTYPPWTTPYWTFPPNVRCGRPSFPHPRVIGGQNAYQGSWPWQAALYVMGKYFMCGGSLVSPNWVVTAAHCIIPYLRNRYHVVLGDYNRNITEGSEQSIRVSKVIVHPQWNASTINNDIALLKLEYAAMLTKYVKHVCLPKQDDYVRPGKSCYITGWGKIKHPGSATTILQQAYLPVISKSECQQKLSSSNETYPGIKITDYMICGGEKGSIKSGCHGDSGGPYVCEEKGSYFLQGVVSWGSHRCDALDKYSVFARVARYRHWFDYHMSISK